MGEPDLELVSVHVEEVVLNRSGKRSIRLDAAAVDAKKHRYSTEMQNDTSQDTYLIYLGSRGKHFERMERMMKYFADERGAHNYMITSERSVDDPGAFVYPFVNSEYFASMEYVVPMQVLARKLSLDLGIDCNIPSDPLFHKKMGSYTY